MGKPPVYLSEHSLLPCTPSNVLSPSLEFLDYLFRFCLNINSLSITQTLNLGLITSISLALHTTTCNLWHYLAIPVESFSKLDRPPWARISLILKTRLLRFSLICIFFSNSSGLHYDLDPISSHLFKLFTSAILSFPVSSLLFSFC